MEEWRRVKAVDGTLLEDNRNTSSELKELLYVEQEEGCILQRNWRPFKTIHPAHC